MLSRFDAPPRRIAVSVRKRKISSAVTARIASKTFSGGAATSIACTSLNCHSGMTSSSFVDFVLTRSSAGGHARAMAIITTPAAAPRLLRRMPLTAVVAAPA